jgi:chromate transporter
VASSNRSWPEVLRVALGLGLTSFGGPVAHTAYFRREYVERRRWLDEAAFGELVALCQSLPGPASSQLGIAIGTLRAGLAGGIAAWLGFTLPSAVAMLGFALVANAADVATSPWVHGLALASVAVVAHAVLLMRRALAPDPVRRLIAVAAMAVGLAWMTPVTPLVVIAGGAAVGLVVVRARAEAGRPAAPQIPSIGRGVTRRTGLVALALFAALLVGLPVLRSITGWQVIAVADVFYRAGATVFGGGHVVLPILHEPVVAGGWLDENRFLAGYGAAQAVPGPLFTFAGYLGALVSAGPGGIPGALVALVAIFLPGFLLVLVALPFWDAIRRSGVVRRALAGTGASVVGLLAAALYEPVWRSAVASPADAVLALAGLGALAVLRVPPLAVVLAAAGIALAVPGI